MGADSRYEAFLNGKSIVRGTSVRMPDSLDITSDIVEGKNTLAVSAAPGRSSGVIGAVRLDLKDGTTQLITTSSSWKTSEQTLAHWEEPAFDDSGWNAASDLGEYGVAPWGRVGFIEARQLPARMLRREFEVQPGLKARHRLGFRVGPFMNSI